jgi:excisionase family DNA binding protein
LTSERRRVPHVQAVAVVGSHTLIGGFPAYFLSRLLVNLPGGLTAQLGRYGLSAEHHADVLRAVDGLRHAGAAWQLERAREAGSGSGSDPANEIGPRLLLKGHEGASFHGSSLLLSADDAASVLGISGRRVRMLAGKGLLPGHRDSGGRWRFAAADVEAVREQRALNGAA